MSEYNAVPPYHRWPSNEDIRRHPAWDRCLTCGVRRWSEDPEVSAKAAGPCPGVTIHQDS